MSRRVAWRTVVLVTGVWLIQPAGTELSVPTGAMLTIVGGILIGVYVGSGVSA